MDLGNGQLICLASGCKGSLSYFQIIFCQFWLKLTNHSLFGVKALTVTITFSLFIVRMCACTCHGRCARGGQRAASRSRLSLAAMWVLGATLRS